MLVESVILALIIGLALKGSLTKLSMIELKLLHLPIAAFLLEFIGGYLLRFEVKYFISNLNGLTLIIECLVYGLLIYFFYVNRKLPGMSVVMIGAVLNFTVIIFNLGFMPVDPALGLKYGFNTSLGLLENGRIFAHSMTNDATRLSLLGDHIIVPPPWPWPKTISVGDVIIDIGAIILIIKGMCTGHTNKNSI